MNIAIVTTTINVPLALEGYARNAREYGHTGISFIVAGDRKTASGAREFCRRLNREYAPCEYLDIEDQRRYCERFPHFWNYLPFDCIQRRNVALLKAYEDGADVVITVDDDNLVTNHDFIAHHSKAGTWQYLPVYQTTSGWFNVCGELVEQQGTAFYHRGHPVKQRWNDNSVFTTVAEAKVRTVVNAGFWLDDPDIDALTRLHRQPVVTGMRPQPGGRLQFALQPGTWSPFNSQNTALAREVIPAYCVLPFVGRYDDIWPSYLVNRIASHLGDAIAFGLPFVRQVRNPHDLWRDLDAERAGMQMTDQFCEVLQGIPLRGSTYHACYGELLEGLRREWRLPDNAPQGWVEMREGTLAGIEVWWEMFHAVKDRGAADDIANLARRTAS
jgi:hypothetical protein